MLHPHADISLSVASIIMISSPRPAFPDPTWENKGENRMKIAVPRLRVHRSFRFF